MNKNVALIVVTVVLLVACAPASGVAVALSQTAPAATSTTQALQATATASAVPATATQLPPTNTAAPTNTPAPTSTPKPSDTPEPTATDTPIPEPIHVAGKGDQIVDVTNPFGAAILHAVGNKGSRYFGVTAYDSDNNAIDGLVNTTDKYDGYVPLDFRDGEHTARLEVKAVGDWTIDILPLADAHRMDIPGSYSGTGDDVVIMRGDGTPDTAHITGNKGARYFGVTSYGSDGQIDGLVNTTDNYDGNVIMSSKAVILEIKAIGGWTIEVKTK